MSVLTASRGWPFAHPPAGVAFGVNRRSPQAVGLVGWWPTVGQSTTGLVREYVSGAHGAGAGNTALRPDGTVGAAYAMDGTGDYIAVGAAAKPILDCPAGVTLSAWINIPTTAGGLRVIAGDANASATVYQYVLEVNNVAGRINAAWGGAIYGGSSTTLSVNTWYHVAMVRSGTTGAWTVTYYVNGQSDGAVSGIATNPGTQQGFGIGCAGLFTLTVTFNGLLSDVRVYNRALSPAEVYAMYAPQTRWQLYRSLMPAARERVGSLAGLLLRRRMGATA